MTNHYDSYVENRATATMHSVPRFGHSSEFSDLFIESERDDYSQGLVFIAAFCMAVVVVWSALLLILACLGRNQIAIWSSSDQVPVSKCRRMSFLFAAGILGLSAVVLVTQGVTELTHTVDVFAENNQEIQGILVQAKDIVQRVRNVGDDAVGIRRDVLTFLESDLCPGDASVQNTTTLMDIRALAEETVVALVNLKDFISTDLQEIQNGIETVMEGTLEVERIAQDVEEQDWQGLVILAVYLPLTALLGLGVLLSACGKLSSKLECCLDWVIFPLFIVAIGLAWSMTAGISGFTISNADFCSGGVSETPDDTVLTVLRNYNYTEESISYQAVEYYVSQCSTDATNPLDPIEEFQTTLSGEPRRKIVELRERLQQAILDLVFETCGVDYQVKIGLLDLMIESIDILLDSSERTLELMACDRIVPIYTEVVYDGTCDQSIEAFSWTFAGFLTIGFMGMVMITLAVQKPYIPMKEQEETVVSNTNTNTNKYDDEPKKKKRKGKNVPRGETTEADDTSDEYLEPKVMSVYAEKAFASPSSSRETEEDYGLDGSNPDESPSSANNKA